MTESPLETWLAETIHAAVKDAMGDEIKRFETAVRAGARALHSDSVVPLPEDKPILKVTEVASILKVSKNRVYALINAGDLEVIRWGTRVLVPTHRLRQFLGLDPPDDLSKGMQ